MPLVVANAPDSNAIRRFHYTRLTIPDYSIRVVEVCPDDDNGPVRIRLLECERPLLTAPFRCLSYMWGDPSDDNYEIIVNDGTFTVRRNLYQFLRTAGRRFPDTPLWIDAICIDQQNDHEKEEQVARMADIYRMALETIIWLGDNAQVGSAIEWLASGHVDWSNTTASVNLERLYSDPYWTRMWVDWKRIGAAAKTRPRKGRAVLDISQKSNPEYYWAKWSDRHSKKVKDTQEEEQPEYYLIWDLLTTLSASQCADPRDRIYSLLALVKGGSRFPVSYTVAPINLFWKAGEHFGAWARPTTYISALRLALGLSVQDISDSLDEHARTKLTIELRYVPPRSAWAALTTKPTCGHGACKKQGIDVQKDRSDILFCARVDPKDQRDFPCAHVLVHPVKRDTKDLNHKSDTFYLTLIIPNTPRSLSLKKTLDRSALLLQFQYGRDKVHNWSCIENNITKYRQGERWWIDVPPSFIVEILETLERSVNLLHNEIGEDTKQTSFED